MNPVFYRVAVMKHRMKRWVKWILAGKNSFSSVIQEENLPVLVVSHRSLLLRKLAGTDIELQKNKIKSLQIAASAISGIIISPGEEFSFWRLVGNPTRKKGYPPGLQLSFGKLISKTGGGLCQFSNLLHWMVLQSPLVVTERHRHSTDPFPDYKRTVPFGTGATVFYNYLDFCFRNETDSKFQVKVWLDKTHLNGEIRSDKELSFLYRVEERGHRFVRKNGKVYRENEIWCIQKDMKSSSPIVSEKLLFRNFVEVLYEVSNVIVD